MRIERSKPKRSIKFEEIREGTAFTKADEVYIKGTGGIAMNVETGKVLYPLNGDISEWNECYIYPRASINLNPYSGEIPLGNS